MPPKFLLHFLPTLLVFLVHAPLGESLPAQCYPVDGRTPHRPMAADCLHIASVFPLQVPSEHFAHAYHEHNASGSPFANHRFQFPANFRHGNCELFLYTQSATPSQQFTSQEAAIYLWDSLKHAVEDIVHRCLLGPVNFAGIVHLFGHEIGLWDEREEPAAILAILPGGRVPQARAAERFHVYYV